MFCTQPFNHIDVIVENEKVQLQPCNVWSSKRHSIIDYQKNIQEIQNTLKENYYYPGCETCFREDKNNIRSRRVAQNQFSNDNGTPAFLSVFLRNHSDCGSDFGI